MRPPAMVAHDTGMRAMGGGVKSPVRSCCCATVGTVEQRGVMAETWANDTPPQFEQSCKNVLNRSGASAVYRAVFWIFLMGLWSDPAGVEHRHWRSCLRINRLLTMRSPNVNDWEIKNIGHSPDAEPTNVWKRRLSG
jgi:hypothetical protein